MAVRQEATPTCALSGFQPRGHRPPARPERDSTCWPSVSPTAWTERCLPGSPLLTSSLAARGLRQQQQQQQQTDTCEERTAPRPAPASTRLAARGRGEGRVPTEAENRDPGCSHGGRGDCLDLGERENVREAPGEQRLLRPHHAAPVTPRRSSTPRKPRGRPLPRS